MRGGRFARCTGAAILLLAAGAAAADRPSRKIWKAAPKLKPAARTQLVKTAEVPRRPKTGLTLQSISQVSPGEEAAMAAFKAGGALDAAQWYYAIAQPEKDAEARARIFNSCGQRLEEARDALAALKVSSETVRRVADLRVRAEAMPPEEFWQASGSLGEELAEHLRTAYPETVGVHYQFGAWVNDSLWLTVQAKLNWGDPAARKASLDKLQARMEQAVRFYNSEAAKSQKVKALLEDVTEILKKPPSELRLLQVETAILKFRELVGEFL